MVSRDYTKEVGLPSATKTVSKPVAIVILALMAAGGWYAVATLAATHHASEGGPAPAIAHSK